MAEDPNWADKATAVATALGAIGAAVAAVGAIWIPIAIDENAKTSRSVETVDKAGRIIDKIVADKKRIDDDGNISETERYSPDYINKDKNAVQSLVFRLLNEYDGLCAAVNLDVIREDVLLKFRGGSLAGTWRDYQAYIQRQRGVAKGAWTECDEIVARYSHHAQD